MDINADEENQQIIEQPKKRLVDVLNRKLTTETFLEDKQKTSNNESAFTKDMSRTSLFNKRSRKPLKWSEEDTNIFYKCLEIFGMDFSMIAEVLSHKTQRQLLRKYHKERKRDPNNVNAALQRHESNLIHKDQKARNFLEGVFKLTSNSEASDNNTLDDSLENAVAKKLKLLLDVPKKDVEETIEPLEYYLKELE